MDADEISKDKETENGINKEKRNRRSSILKSRKSINPLPDESTAEVLTTEKTSRRVSFANINFVKPFATDPEKTTIWDNTYEEIVDHSDSTKGDTEGPGFSDATSITLPEFENVASVVKTSIQIKETASSTKYIAYEIAQGVNECDKENAKPVVKKAVPQNRTVIFDTTQSNMEFTGNYANLDFKAPKSIIEFAKQQRLKQNLNFASNVTDVAMEMTCAFSSDRTIGETPGLKSRAELRNTTIRPMDNMELTLANDEVSKVVSTDMEFTTMVGNAKTVYNNIPSEPVQNDDMEFTTNIFDCTGAALNRTQLISNVSDTGMDFTCNLTRFPSVRETLQTEGTDMEFTTNLAEATMNFPNDARTGTVERTLCQKPSENQMERNMAVPNSPGAEMEFTCNLASVQPTSTSSSAAIERIVQADRELSILNGPPNQTESKLAIPIIPDTDMEFTSNLVGFKPLLTRKNVQFEETDMEFTTNLASARNFSNKKNIIAEKPIRSELPGSKLANLNISDVDMEFTSNLAGLKFSMTGLRAATSKIFPNGEADTKSISNAAINTNSNKENVSVEIPLSKNISVSNGHQDQKESDLVIPSIPDTDMEFTSNLVGYKPIRTKKTVEAEVDNMKLTTISAVAGNSIKKSVTTEKTLSENLSVNNESENHMESKLATLSISDADMDFTRNLVGFKPSTTGLPVTTRKFVPTGEVDTKFTTDAAVTANSNKENVSVKIPLSKNISVSNVHQHQKESDVAIPSIPDADMEFTRNLVGHKPISTRKAVEADEDTMKFTTNAAIVENLSNKKNVTAEKTLCEKLSVNDRSNNVMKSKLAIPSIPVADVEYNSNLVDVKPLSTCLSDATRRTLQTDIDDKYFSTNLAGSGHLSNNKQGGKAEKTLCKEPLVDKRSNNPVENKLPKPEIPDEDMEATCDLEGLETGLPIDTGETVEAKADTKLARNVAGVANPSNYKNTGAAKRPLCRQTLVVSGSGNRTECATDSPIIKRSRGQNVSNETPSDELMPNVEQVAEIVTSPISEGEFAERVDTKFNTKDIANGTQTADDENEYLNRLGRGFTTTPTTSFAMNFSMSPCVEDTQYLIHATFSKPESLDVLMKGQQFRKENMDENKCKFEDDGASNGSIDSSDNVEKENRFVAGEARIVYEDERQNKSCWDLTNTSDNLISNTTPELVDVEDSVSVGEGVSVDEKHLPATQEEPTSETSRETTTTTEDTFDYRNYTMRCNKILDDIKRHLVHIEPDPYFDQADKRCDELCAKMAENRAWINNFKKNFRLPQTRMIDFDEFFEERGNDDSSTSLLSDGFSADETGSRLSMADFVPPKCLLERVRDAAERSQKYWQFLKTENDYYHFNCLFGAIEFKVHVHPDLGIVYSIQTSNELEDVSTPLAHYGTNVLELKLKQEHLLPALGPKFDVLALLDYVCLCTDEIVEFHKEFQQLEKEYGFTHKLVMQPGNTVTFEIINVHFIVCWTISIEMSLNNVGYKERVSAKTVVGEKVNEEDIQRIAENCTKGVNFLRNMIEKVDEYVQRVLRRLAFQRESKPV